MSHNLAEFHWTLQILYLDLQTTSQKVEFELQNYLRS